MAMVTCHTEECVNRDVPVEIAMSFEIDGESQTVDIVACGGCGQTITDIAE